MWLSTKKFLHTSKVIASFESVMPEDEKEPAAPAAASPAAATETKPAAEKPTVSPAKPPAATDAKLAAVATAEAPAKPSMSSEHLDAVAYCREYLAEVAKTSVPADGVAPLVVAMSQETTLGAHTEMARLLALVADQPLLHFCLRSAAPLLPPTRARVFLPL